MEQLSFWGYDDDGYRAATGNRTVYFVASGAFIKIGFTTRDVDERIRELTCGNPDNLELIGTLIVSDDEDDHRLHHRFASFHHRGEWFDKTPKLLAAIEDLMTTQQPERRPTVRYTVERKFAGSEVVIGPICPGCRGWLVLAVKLPALPWPTMLSSVKVTHGCGSVCRLELLSENP